MRITILGTGTSLGVPVIACNCQVCTSPDPRDNRLRSSIMVEDGNRRILVDAGPDFRQQMLKHHVSNLDAVLLTHEHADHIFGLDDIRSFNWVRKAAMDIYCERRVILEISNIFKYAFAENRYPGTPQMKLIPIDNDPFLLQGMEVVPVRLFHHKLPVFGFRFGKFAYLTDFNRIDEPELSKLMGIEVLLIGALRKEAHVAHLSLTQAIDLIQLIAPQKTYLTHMSHEIGLHAKLITELPAGVEPAYDGLVLDI